MPPQLGVADSRQVVVVSSVWLPRLWSLSDCHRKVRKFFFQLLTPPLLVWPAFANFRLQRKESAFKRHQRQPATIRTLTIRRDKLCETARAIRTARFVRWFGRAAQVSLHESGSATSTRENGRSPCRWIAARNCTPPPAPQGGRRKPNWPWRCRPGAFAEKWASDVPSAG